MSDADVAAAVNRIAAALEKAAQGQRSGFVRGFLKAIPTLLTTVVAVVGLLLVLNPIKTDVEGFINAAQSNSKNLPLSRLLIAKVRASSYRQDLHDTSVFFPQNILDNDLTTAWAECRNGSPRFADGRSKNCAKSDMGVGEWLEVEFTSPQDLKTIRIADGYENGAQLYFQNPRVRTIDVSLDGGSPTSFVLQDEPGYQEISMAASRARMVRFTIHDVYPGEEFLGNQPFDDTSISEIQFIPQKVDVVDDASRPAAP